MKYVYKENGELVGKFDERKVELIATNWKPIVYNWENIIRTQKGNYLIEYKILWGKNEEKNKYEKLTKEEAIDLMEQWGYGEEEIREKFPEYIPQETI